MASAIERDFIDSFVKESEMGSSSALWNDGSAVCKCLSFYSVHSSMLDYGPFKALKAVRVSDFLKS